MVQITGKYEIIKSENLASHLITFGCPADIAKEAENSKAIHEFKHDGNKISVDLDLDGKFDLNWILNETVEEHVGPDLTIKTTATLNGDTLTLKSRYPNGKTETKIHKFTDTGFTVTFQDGDPATPDAIRVYKRL